jgi:hypothetical protein
VDDEVAVVEQHPREVAEAFDLAHRAAPRGTHLHGDLVDDRPNLPVVPTGGDDEVVRDSEEVAHVDDHGGIEGLRPSGTCGHCGELEGQRTPEIPDRAGRTPAHGAISVLDGVRFICRQRTAHDLR